MTERTRETLGYVSGWLIAAILTVSAFAVVRWQNLLGPWTFMAVCALGFIQAIVQFRFFLHVRLRGTGRDDLMLLMFTSLIIVLMVAGTLVLMANLHNRMM